MRGKIWDTLYEYIYIAGNVDVYEEPAVAAVVKLFDDCGIAKDCYLMDIPHSRYHLASFAWVDSEGNPQVESFLYVKEGE